MKKILIDIIFLFIIIFFAGCSNNSTPSEASVGTGTTLSSVISPDNKENVSEKTNQPAMNQFSILTPKGYISLQDHDNEVNLNDILGVQMDESLKNLGPNADAHHDSIIKTLIYDGITVKLFSPPNGGFFWVMNMKITGNDFKTFRDISVGDTLSDLKQAYNDIRQVLDGRTDPNNCAYSFNENELFLQFEIKDGVIKEMFYYVEIP